MDMADSTVNGMSGDSRRKQIIQILREQDEASVEELSQALAVSKVTVRKDLQLLEDQGYLTRVRGGAIFSGRGQLELRFAARQQISLDEKRRVAERAACYIEPGSTVFLDGSSTVYQLTRQLRYKNDLTVVTNGLYTALELSFTPQITTLVVGGIVRPRSSSLIDLLSPELLRRLHFDIAFLSCRGFTPEQGMMESDLREAQLKRAMALEAQKVVALFDHTKVGRTYIASSVLVDDIDVIVVDSGVPGETLRALEAMGSQVEVV